MKSSSGTTDFKINSLRNEVSYSMSSVVVCGSRCRSPYAGNGVDVKSPVPWARICLLPWGVSPGCGTWRQVVTSDLPSLSRKPSALCNICTGFLRWRRTGAAACSLGAAVTRCSPALRGARQLGVMVEVRVGAHADSVASTRDANGGSAHLDFAGEVDLFTPILEGIPHGRGWLSRWQKRKWWPTDEEGKERHQVW